MSSLASPNWELLTAFVSYAFRFVEKMLERYIRQFFTKHGQFCAEHPVGVFVVGALFCIVMAIGIVHLQLEQSPVHLWVEPQSRTARDMDYFDDAFHPFFRVEEIVLSSKAGDGTDVISNEALFESFAFHNELLNTRDPETGISLLDICWKPLAGKGCLTQSWLNFFQGNVMTAMEIVNRSNPLSASHWFFNCVSNPISQPCFSALDLPTEPIVVFGKGAINETSKTYHAQATLITYLIENSNEQDYVSAVRSWEKNVFLRLAKNWSATSNTVRVDYMAQRSVQDALVSEESDHSSIIFSYVGMFVYITIALGYFSKVHSKGCAALLGILIVMASIISSVGFCSTLGVPLTLIIVDVIPFLLVAIGVDNMFIISNEFWFRCRIQMRQVRRGTPLSRQQIATAMSEALGEVGGTIFLAGASEGLAFSLGALTSMPAVRAFCLYSGVAILVNLALQVTVFVAFLTLDARRAAAGRYDMLPCIQHELDEKTVDEYNPMVEPGDDDPDFTSHASPTLPLSQGQRFPEQSTDALKAENRVRAVCQYQLHKERIRDQGFYSFARLVRTFLRKYYVPNFLFNRLVQVVVVIGFIVVGFALLFTSSDQVELGLRPTDPIPDHYYLRSTLTAIEDYLQVGPLIYFASPAPHLPLVNFSDPAVFKVMDNLYDTLKTDTAYIEPATVASWFDDFRYWLCYYHGRDERNFTVADGCIDLGALGFTPQQANASLMCSHGKAHRIPDGWLVPALKQFLNTPRCCYDGSTNTGICGFQYDQEVIIGHAFKDKDGNMFPVSGEKRYDDSDTFEYITASRLRAQTLRLSTNRDYIASLASAYNATDVLNQVTEYIDNGVSVFPYSIYFVFYSQYLDLPYSAAKQLALALGAVVLVTFLVLSSVSSTLSVSLCIVLILVDLAAIMHWWSIDVNAISVVNMVMCVGIAVEFCAHIAVAFCGTKGPIRKRMMASMVDMGSNVICGITLTKLLGVSILALSPSKVFRKYYFRMYCSMVILGALHGLVFLPCLLLLIGSSLRQKRYKFATL